MSGDPIMHFAHGQVFQAVSAGLLVRPAYCEKCGDGPTEAHHPDYSKPLEVEWLCRRCHKAQHLKTHCVHGHEYTAENTYFRKSGERYCAECQRIRSRSK